MRPILSLIAVVLLCFSYCAESQPVQGSGATELVSELEEQLAELTATNAAMQAQIDQYRGAIPWPWVLGAVLVALGLGFVAGYLWLDAVIRRRHGGFRVY